MYMWKLYDDLYIGIPSGILVEGCVVGKTWTVVRANGNIGLARTLGSVDGASAYATGFLGQPLREVANHLLWKTPVRASVGMAALNCWYNTADRVAGLDGKVEGTIELPVAFADEAAGKRVALVGDLPWVEAALAEKCTLTKLPCPAGEEPDEETKAALPQADYIYISSDAITMKAIPALLDLVPEGAKVSLTGPSVPAAPVFFAWDMPIHNLTGFYPRFDNTVEAAALLDLEDLTPGMLPFSIAPQEIHRIYESDASQRFAGSPYKASAFNSRFTPWDGRDCDKSKWSPIFKG